MHHHGGFDYERMDEIRQRTVNVKQIEDFVELKTDDIICDMGSGSGFYSLIFAKKCKHVYSFEWNDRGNSILEKRINEENIKNITIRKENICGEVSFPTCTKVFFSNSFHDFQCRENLIEKFREISRPEFILIEFKKNGEMGPPIEIRIGEEELQMIFARHGYKMKKKIEFASNYVSYFTPE